MNSPTAAVPLAPMKLVAVLMVSTLVFTAGNVPAAKVSPLLALVPTAIVVAALVFVWRPVRGIVARVEPMPRQRLWRVTSRVTATVMALGLLLMVVSLLIWAALFTGSFSPSLVNLAAIVVNGALVFWPMLVGVGAFGLTLTVLLASAPPRNVG